MNDQNTEQFVTVPATEKVTLRLPVYVIERMEEIVFEARKNLARTKAKELTKSKLTELVLSAVINEYDRKAERCVVSDLIFNWVEN